MAEKEVRKTTTKRAVRRTTTKTVPAKTTARQAGVTSARKAPTRTAAPSTTRRSAKGFIVGFVVFLVLLGASAGIGFSDKGQLNVENMITMRKQNATGEEKVLLETVPVQQTKNDTPNGGLVGMGQAELPPPPVIEVSTSTDATSTSQSTETGTSTSEAAEEIPTDTNAESAQVDESAPATEVVPETIAQ